MAAQGIVILLKQGGQVELHGPIVFDQTHPLATEAVKNSVGYVILPGKLCILREEMDALFVSPAILGKKLDIVLGEIRQVHALQQRGQCLHQPLVFRRLDELIRNDLDVDLLFVPSIEYDAIPIRL